MEWKILGLGYETISVYIGLLTLIVCGIIPIVTYLKQKEKKKLIFEGLHNLSLKNIKGDLKNEFEIRYPDRLAGDFFLLIANIRNNGDLSIRNYDIITPIKISFPEKFIDCFVTTEYPEGVDVRLTVNHDENSVECNFELLNVLDYFTIAFVSLEKLSIPKIVYRIDGLSNINTDNFDIIYVSLNPVMRGLKKVLSVLRDTDFTKPIFTFAVPGIIMVIASLYMGLNFLQTFAIGGSLNFGPVILMLLLLIGGASMVLLGIMIHFAFLNNKSYTMSNKPSINIAAFGNLLFVLLGSLLLTVSLYMGVSFLRVFAVGGRLQFGPTMVMVMLFVIGLFMILIGLMMYIIFSKKSSERK